MSVRGKRIKSAGRSEMACGGRKKEKEKKGRRMREEEQDEAAPSLSPPSPT